jgi:putative phosphoribosyl transferase
LCQGREVILVDDGLATGASMKAVASALRLQDPQRIVIAVPVGARDTCDELRSFADELICAHSPSHFVAVGAMYQDFAQTSDEEVYRLLAECRVRYSTPAI